MDELLLFSQLNKDFSNSAALEFHGNLAERCHSGQRASSSELSADRIWSRRRINGEIARRRDVLLHQWEVVFRCNSVKEDVLILSRNALHQLQTVQLAAGVLFVHSRECLHSTASARELSFTETRWSDLRRRTSTPGLYFNNSWGL